MGRSQSSSSSSLSVQRRKRRNSSQSQSPSQKKNKLPQKQKQNQNQKESKSPSRKNHRKRSANRKRYRSNSYDVWRKKHQHNHNQPENHKQVTKYEQKDRKYEGGKTQEYNSRRNADDQYGKQKLNKNQSEDENDNDKQKLEVVEKELPCFVPSGILATFQNSVNGAVLKYTIPLDAEIPKEKWSLFPFKGNQSFAKIPLIKESAFLIGKDSRICHILCENPSVSNQHAVIQFRRKKKDTIGYQQEYDIIPYILDLESTNSTFLNGKQISTAQYIQLLEKDVLRFGESMREYVLIKEN